MHIMLDSKTSHTPELQPLSPDQKQGNEAIKQGSELRPGADLRAVDSTEAQAAKQESDEESQKPEIHKSLNPTLEKVRDQEQLDSTLPSSIQIETLKGILNGEPITNQASQIIKGINQLRKDQNPEIK